MIFHISSREGVASSADANPAQEKKLRRITRTRVTGASINKLVILVEWTEQCLIDGLIMICSVLVLRFTGRDIN